MNFLLFVRYVSRLKAVDSSKHVILGTQQFKPKEFANQIALNMDNGWGILRVIIDTCMKLSEGKYLILKDPNKVGLSSYLFSSRFLNKKSKSLALGSCLNSKMPRSQQNKEVSFFR